MLDLNLTQYNMGTDIYSNFGLAGQQLLKQSAKTQPANPIRVPWFPQTKEDINCLGKNIMKGDGLNLDHPGFTDKAYRQRREKIAETGEGYKMGNPIPGVEYDPKETELWGIIWDKLYPKLMEHGCSEYTGRFNRLVNEGLFQRSKIPQLEELNQFLNKETNWNIKPVSGILTQRDFLNCLAYKTFCCTQYIRHYSRPAFSPEPDILHEFMGHIPMLADPKVCEVSQLIG